MIFVQCSRLIARKIAELFGLNRGIRPVYTAYPFNELGRGSVSCLSNASFGKRFHNATTHLFTPKSMTMASAGAIRGAYLPYGGIQSVASRVALDLPYWVMQAVPHWNINMSIEMTSKGGVFFCHSHFLSCKTIAKRPC